MRDGHVRGKGWEWCEQAFSRRSITIATKGPDHHVAIPACIGAWELLSTRACVCDERGTYVLR